MSLKQRKLIGFTILILLVVLASCEVDDVSPEKALNNPLNNYSKLIEKDKFDELSMKIYYIFDSILTRAHYDVRC